MTLPMPALSLAAIPGRRRATIELAREIEQRGFAGIYTPSLGSNMALCEALAHVTERIPFGTSIAPIYARTVIDFAQEAGFLHEVSGGRFRFGIGVSHGPTIKRLGVQVGKPLSDIRQFVSDLHAVERVGEQPPVILATLRKKMIALAGEIAQGMVFANGARSHMPDSLSALPATARDNPDFYIGNMIPTCISEDIEAAKAVNRRTLTSYAMLPNYRNYWKEAGFVEEMEGVEQAIADGALERVPSCLSDRWLSEVTLFGPVSRVKEELAAWYESGIRTPILVPSSAAGNQMKAFEEVFAAFA